MELAMAATSAPRGVIAVKGKHDRLLALLQQAIAGRPDLSLLPLGNYYPAGDEVLLVYAVTGMVPPEGGLPLDVGAVVFNVTSLVNLARAWAGEGVHSRLVTVAGAVRRPVTKLFPIGTSMGEAIAFAGGVEIDSFAVIVGGPMMGRVQTDLDAPITKTVGGILVLPRDHMVVLMKGQDLKRSFARARSVCCQCSFCTDLCPRYLVGHDMRPHLLMRRTDSLEGEDEVLSSAFLCSNCGLCGAFACVMRLQPNKVNEYVKEGLRSRGVKSGHALRPESARPELESRRVPSERLVARLGLDRYEQPERLDLEPHKSTIIRVPLKQHVGVPSLAEVRVGEKVSIGQRIARVPEGALGADVHAGIGGVVRSVADSIVIERA